MVVPKVASARGLKMKVFVINLAQAHDRRVFMEKQLAALNIDAEFFPAVDGRLLPEDEVKRVSDRRWFRRYVGREMTRSDMGCSLSHIYLYRKMVDENITCALILEDDAWLTPSLVPLLNELEQDIAKLPCDVVLLSECRTVPVTIWRRGYYFMSPVAYALFTHAYVVSLRGARLLMNSLFPVALPADAWNWLLRHRLIRIAAVHPVLATQNQPVVTNTEFAVSRALPEKCSLAWFWHKANRVFWKLYDAWVPVEWHRKQGMSQNEL